MSNIKRINVGERMSQVVIYNGLVFTAGQVASSAPNKDVGEQTKNVLDKIDNLLKEAGTNKSNLISANIWLSNINDFSNMNIIWDAWIDKNNPPVRACVESKLASDKFNVEISVIAVK